MAMGSKVWIAYNRRFYASVQKLRQLCDLDGGITSAVFEFTEWSHSLRDLLKGPGVMEHWLLANSSRGLILLSISLGFQPWVNGRDGTVVVLTGILHLDFMEPA